VRRPRQDDDDQRRRQQRGADEPDPEREAHDARIATAERAW